MTITTAKRGGMYLEPKATAKAKAGAGCEKILAMMVYFRAAS